MYLEFLYIFIDYFSILKRRVLLFEWGFPVMAGATCMVLSYAFDINNQYAIIEKSFGYVGTLLGFTLAALTLLLSSDKMKDAKNYLIYSPPLKTIFQHKVCINKLYADSFYKVQKNSHSSFEVICCRS